MTIAAIQLESEPAALASVSMLYDPNEPKCCCGCCCGLRKGLTIYLAIFLALGTLGFYHYAPEDLALFGSTFVGDHIAEEAEAYCASTSRCDAICGPVDDPYDMAALQAVSTGALVLLFVAHVTEGIAMIIGIGAQQHAHEPAHSHESTRAP